LEVHGKFLSLARKTIDIPQYLLTYLDFVVSAKHILKISADVTRFTVYVNEVQIAGLKFDIIGDYDIVDPALFSFFASEGLFEFRTYTIGTFFLISAPNQKMRFEPGTGIYVG
jgi:hypothetical protein